MPRQRGGAGEGAGPGSRAIGWREAWPGRRSCGRRGGRGGRGGGPGGGSGGFAHGGERGRASRPKRGHSNADKFFIGWGCGQVYFVRFGISFGGMLRVLSGVSLDSQLDSNETEATWTRVGFAASSEHPHASPMPGDAMPEHELSLCEKHEQCVSSRNRPSEFSGSTDPPCRKEPKVLPNRSTDIFRQSG